MTDDALRAVERAWKADKGDQAALERYLEAVRRAGTDPVDAIADASGDEAWAGLLRASLPVVRIGRTGRTFGRRLDLFVWNGPHFLSSVDLFEDSSSDAWGLGNRSLLARKLSDESGRDGPPVVTEVPVGATLSVHDLGNMAVARSSWSARREDVLLAADMVVRARRRPKLDPNERVDKPERPGGPRRKVHPYRVDADGTLLRGSAVHVFVREESRCSTLKSWIVYEDGRSRLGPRGALESLEDSIAKVRSGAVATTVAVGDEVAIPGLGTFVVRDGYRGFVDPVERIREIQDELEMLRGAPGTHERCRAAFADYERAEELAVENDAGPEVPALEAARAVLRAAYEAVPEHLRLYILRDMDRKDGPIRRALGLGSRLEEPEEDGAEP
jgi:hypothetical protein